MTEHAEHADPTNPAERTDDAAWWRPTALLTPAAAALAAFAIAFLTLGGQNLLLIGIQSLLGQGFGSSTTPAGYYLVWGLAALVPLGLVLPLARLTLATVRTGWEAHVARAAVLLAAVAAVGAVLAAVGGLLNNGRML